MELKQNLVSWVSRSLGGVGFKPVKRLPPLNEIKEWVDTSNKKIGIFHIFFNHDDALTIYVNNQLNGQTCVYKFDGEITAEQYAELAYISEEEAAEILKNSKKEALSDPKFLGEKERLMRYAERAQVSNKMAFSDLLTLIQENKSTVYKGDNISIEGTGILTDDCLIPNSDKTGVLVADRYGFNKVIGSSDKYFSIFEQANNSWVFFTKSAYLMKRLLEITKTRVVFVKDDADLVEIMAKKSEQQKYVIFLDSSNNNVDLNTYIPVLPLEGYTTWQQYLDNEQDNAVIQAYIRETITPKQ